MLDVFAIPVLFVIDTFWGGFALAQLWSWFVVPLGVPTITFAHAAGLQLMLLMFMASRGVDKGKFDASAALARSSLAPFFGLCLGYCIHWLMLHA